MRARSIGSSSRPSASRPRLCAAICAQRLRLAAIADGADHLALVRQQVLGDVPAAVRLADQVAASATRTSSKKVSQNGDLPEISVIGRVLTPGVAMSKSTKLMPLCFLAALSVRTRQKIQSALSA